MKRLLLSTALLAAFGGAALSQTATDTNTSTTNSTTTAPAPAAGGAATANSGGMFRTERAAGDFLASDFIGMRIYASDNAVNDTAANGVQQNWKDIGEVNDVVLKQDGTVQAVLVDIGGFLGIGERKVAVEMPALKFVSDDSTANSADDFFLVLNADQATLQNAPAYGMGMSEQGAMNSGATGGLSDTGMAVSTNATTGTDATGTAVPGARTATGTSGAMATNDGTGTATGTGDTMGTTAANDGTAPAAAATGTSTRQPTMREGYAPVAGNQLTADMLGKAAAYDANDKRIGDVSDLVMSSDGQVSQAVIDVGGFLGIGTKRVALPISDIDIMQANGSGEIRVYVPHTKEQLQAMPDYQS